LRITVDTSVLVRAAVLDDPKQGKLAADLLRGADVIAVSLPALCEFAWVMARGYGRTSDEVLGMIRSLLESSNVRVDRLAVDAGLTALMAGGDFADGVIAFEGRRLGGDVFASFDRKAIRLIAGTGAATYLLSDT
jgi:predicted nucleic-acid-binding protein